MRSIRVTGIIWMSLGIVGSGLFLLGGVADLGRPTTGQTIGSFAPVLAGIILSCGLTAAGYGVFKLHPWGRSAMLVLLPPVVLWSANLSFFHLWRARYDWFFLAVVLLTMLGAVCFAMYLFSFPKSSSN